MPRRYVPDRGDIVWLQFNPQAGNEQAGHRPAIVISPKEYNQKVGLALFCPITSQIKGYPFEVIIPKRKNISGAIVSDQLKSLDWRASNAERIFKASEDIVIEVLSKIATLVSISR